VRPGGHGAVCDQRPHLQERRNDPLGCRDRDAQERDDRHYAQIRIHLADGVFSFTTLKPDSYWLAVNKRGYTFPAPTTQGNPAVTVGPDKSAIAIKANP